MIFHGYVCLPEGIGKIIPSHGRNNSAPCEIWENLPRYIRYVYIYIIADEWMVITLNMVVCFGGLYSITYIINGE